jgi:hypothetical protein
MLKIIAWLPRAVFLSAFVISLILAIRRRGMWVPRFLLIAGLLSLYLTLPLLQCIGFSLFLMVLCLLILFWLARFITPLPRNHPEFNRSRKLLWWYMVRRIFSLHPPAYVVEGGRREERIAGARFQRRIRPLTSFTNIVPLSLSWLERLLFSYSPVLIRSDSVAVLQLFVTPSRLVGNRMVFKPDIRNRQGEIVEGTTEQGTTICFLDLYEDVEGAIDLRPQRKVSTFKAHSNDNMEVDLQLLMDISPSQAFPQREPEYVYTYDPAEILRAFYFQSPSELETLSWDERFFSVAIAQLSKAVLSHSLGDIYDNAHVGNSSQILEEDLIRLLGETIRPPGRIELLRVALTRVEPKAVEYSLRNWEARVEVKEKPAEAEAEAAYWREVSKAKLSFFTRLMENISEVFKGTERKDLEIALSMRMAKIVEELAHSLAEKGLLSPEAAATLERIGVYKALSPGGS